MMSVALANLLNEIVAFTPRLLAAVLVLVFGLLLARWLRSLIERSAGSRGVARASSLAAGLFYLLVLLVVLSACGILGIGLATIEHLLLIAAAGLSLAFALAVGLGGRDLTASLLAGYFVRRQFQVGDQIEVAGYSGTIREVGPTATTIETEEDGLMNRRSVPNARMLNEAVR